MERRINKKTQAHEVAFKNAMKGWIEDKRIAMYSTEEDSDSVNKTSEFLQFMYDYTGLVFDKEDFQKRKRVKNLVPYFERCTARRANGEQCTRRKRTDNPFCGTHVKGTPHGMISTEDSDVVSVSKIEVWVQEIKGINYYIDSANNVYKSEDIISNTANPSVIAKWVGDPTTAVYSIPEFNI